MPFDYERALAQAFTPFDVYLEQGRLRAFARAIGETDPLYSDVDAARDAGHPDLLMPPTFLFSLYLETPDPWGFMTDLGADFRGMLHGEQTFAYHRLAYAADTLAVQPRIAEAYRKNASMDFVKLHVDVLRGDDLVGETDSLLVVRKVAAA